MKGGRETEGQGGEGSRHHIHAGRGTYLKESVSSV